MPDRTPEQVDADNELTAAIEKALASRDFTPGLLTDYVVVVASQRFDADGDMRTEYGSLYREDGLPHYRVMGLLQVATMQIEDGFRSELSD